MYSDPTGKGGKSRNEDEMWDGYDIWDLFTVTKERTESTTESTVKTDDCICGKKGFGNHKRNFIERNHKRNDESEQEEISGGEEALPKEFPWLVRLVSGCAGGEFICFAKLKTKFHNSQICSWFLRFSLFSGCGGTCLDLVKGHPKLKTIKYL